MGAGVDTAILDLRLYGDLEWETPEVALEPTLRLVGATTRSEGGYVIIEHL